MHLLGGPSYTIGHPGATEAVKISNGDDVAPVKF